MTTIVEVAERARVSIATVSNVIRGTRPVSAALQDRVHTAIRELDYYPNELARSLKIQQTRILGMVLPDITNPFFPDVIRGAEDAAFERGYFLVTANTDEQSERERRIVSALRSYRVAGVLLAPAPGKDTRHIRNLIEAGVSVVCLDRAISSIKTDAVLLDNVGGARECVRHLIQAGHRRIAVVTGLLELQIGRERLRGYKDALHEAGIKVSQNLILEGDFRDSSGYRLGKELLCQRERPTAIFVCNGVMTLGVLKAFEEMGVQCPKDMALATFDDLVVDRSFRPHLTAVVQPGHEIGAQAATILMDRIEGKLSMKKRLVMRIAPTLVVRESTRAE